MGWPWATRKTKGGEGPSGADTHVCLATQTKPNKTRPRIPRGPPLDLDVTGRFLPYMDLVGAGLYNNSNHVVADRVEVRMDATSRE